MKRTLLCLCCPALPLWMGAGCSQNTFVPPPPPEVTVQSPVRRDVTVYDGFPGRIEAVDSVEVRARVRGYLQAVHFKDGSFVEKGAPLFTIEPELYQAALQAAEAALTQAQASDQLAGAGYERKLQASKTGAVSELDLLTAEAEKRSAEAAVQAAEADVAAMKLDLSYTEVSCPVSGRIGRRMVSVGNLVGGTEATLLTTVVVQDPLHVYFNIDERIALRLFDLDSRHDKPDRKVGEVFLELADGERFDQPAQPEYLDPTFNPKTGTLAVRAVLDNPGGQIMPGMYARVLVPIELKNAVLVPEAAIQRDLAGPYLLVVDGEGMVNSAYVELGPEVDKERVIVDGILPEDRIIVNGLQRARPGIKVNPTEAGAAPAPDMGDRGEEADAS